jgi:hypothetical protein
VTALADVHEPLRHALVVQSHLWSLGYPGSATASGYGRAVVPGGTDEVLCAMTQLRWGDVEWYFTEAVPDREDWPQERLDAEVGEAFAAWNAASVEDRIASGEGGPRPAVLIVSLMAKALWPIPKPTAA